MRIPLILWASFWVMLLPVALAMGRRRSLDAPKQAVILWLLSMLFQSSLARVWVTLVDRSNNLIIGLVFLPVEGAAILWAIAEWQVLPIARTTVRLFIPLYAVGWAVSLWLVEDLRGYSVVAAPVLGLLVLASALFALVSRAQRDHEPLLRTDWGWILAGVAIYFATNATFTIPQQIGLMHNDMPFLVRTSILKAWIDVLAMLIISGGFLWSRPPRSSGVSSSSAPSP